MDFSVIIPSRNRPELLRQAVKSVMDQAYDSYEIIVVNDGSDEECSPGFVELEKEFQGKLRVLNLERSLNGHGQSYAINMGANEAKGKYLCFLDDDDCWVSAEHLNKAANIIKSERVDVYFTNQKAYRNNSPVDGFLWLASLEQIIKGKSSLGAVNKVSVKDLMKCPGFSHLNTTIVKKSLYESIGGMDENIRYECDRDFYNRLIDSTDDIYYNPLITSRHNIPDKTKSTSMSTTVSYLEKMLFRLYLLDKAILFSRKREIKLNAKQHKTYTLKHIAMALHHERNHSLALFYAKEALLISFSFKRLAYYFYKQLTNFIHRIFK